MSLRQPAALFAGAAVALALSGCALTDSWGEFWHQTKRASKVKAEDRQDTTDDAQPQWKFVGEEGRRGQAFEKDPDQWWRNYVMSEKARSIEENLGYQ